MGDASANAGRDEPTAASEKVGSKPPHRSLSRSLTAIASNKWFQWFMLHYPTIGVIISILISTPLAAYKYHIAKDDEIYLVEKEFRSLAKSIYQTVDSKWHFVGIAPSMLANVMIATPGPLSAQQLWTYADSNGYFASVETEFNVGLYQHATPETTEKWRKWMFDAYGGNFGSNSTFNFFDRVNGSVVVNNNRTDFYFLQLLHPNDAGAVGFVANSDAARTALLQKLQERGGAAVTGRVRFASSLFEKYGVLMAAPVYRNTTPNATATFTNDFTGNLEAFAFVGAEGSVILNQSLTPFPTKPSLHAFLFDLDATPNQSFLGHYSSPADPYFDNFTRSAGLTEKDVMALSYDFVETYTISPSERTWKLIVMATTGYADFSNDITNSFPAKLFAIALIEPAFAIVFHFSIFIVHWLSDRKRSKSIQSAKPVQNDGK
ncbi:hypothetical protein DFJ73DRAFT_512907 [Zopfochytrium polystomum]|nr:hypothetical protein DFJ73DRAFT_512907 [Zopfochytrium polystomum]